MTRRLTWLAVIAVCAALAVTLVRPAERLVRHLAGQITITAEGLQRQDIAPRADAVDTASIRALAPFGSVDAPQTTTAPSDQGRQLDVRLSGVLVAPDPAASRALVLIGGKGGFYRVGDEVAPDAILMTVRSDAVGIEVDGTLRDYGFDGLIGDDTPGPVAPAETPETGGSAQDRFAASVVPGRGSLDLRDPPPPENTEEYIALWRQRIIENPNGVLETIGLEAGDNGYTIKQDPNIGVTLAGLRPGDVVTRVNGQAVGNPEKDRTFYDEIAASGHARLEVVRGGEKILMSFPLR